MLSRRTGYIWLLLVLGLTLTTVPAVFGFAKDPTWTVYHSWDGGHSYSRRGTLQWTGTEFQLDNDVALTKDQVSAMMDFGWYHVKIDTINGDYVMSTVPACNLRRANFKDEFTLLLPRVTSSKNNNNNNEENNELYITSVSYTPIISALAPKSCEDEFYETNALPDSVSFTTSKVEAVLDTPGMKLRTVLPKMKPPPGYIWLLHPNAKKGSASSAVPGVEPEQEKAQQPFFIKYWYIILPMILANFLPASPENKPPLPADALGPAAVEGAASGAATGGGETASAGMIAGGGGGSATPQKPSRRNKRA